MSPSKLRLMALLASGMEAPQEAAQRLGVAAVTVYHHLTVLRALGLVQMRKVGQCTRYSISPQISQEDIHRALKDVLD
jgi:DNA-binding transcriptional ArsR family regulator